jgi:hypothetical protein
VCAVRLSDKVKEHGYCHVQGNEQADEEGDGSGWLGHWVVSVHQRVSETRHGESPNQNVTQSRIWIRLDVQVRDEQKRGNVLQIVQMRSRNNNKR